LRGVPSPWTEAAKGIFHIKRLPHLLATRAADEPETALTAWAGDVGVPVVAFENEKLRTGWAEILLLAERLAPEPALIPLDAEARAAMFGIAHEICGEMGLGWAYRLVMIERSISGDAKDTAFPSQIGRYLGPRYGYRPEDIGGARSRVIALLEMLSKRIDQNAYLMGDVLTAVDVYWATFANLMVPLPPELMATSPMIRAAYTCHDDGILAAISPKLRAHQRAIYERYLELPVAL
jgi:glutathione S-transferase